MLFPQMSGQVPDPTLTNKAGRYPGQRYKIGTSFPAETNPEPRAPGVYPYAKPAPVHT